MKTIYAFIVIYLIGGLYFLGLVKAETLQSVEGQRAKVVQTNVKRTTTDVDGHVLLDSNTDRNIKLGYIMAAIDTIHSLQPDFFKKKYPGATRGNIIDAVFEYYNEHFTRRHIRVIDLILSGELEHR
ncbi:MAG: hypothetical protein V2A72_04475 [Candidatus Omnitrophota bacterium]